MRRWSTRALGLVIAITIPASAGAQAIDKQAIWTANKQTVVKLKVTGRDVSGNPKAVQAGSGVMVRGNGDIVTALHVVGADAEWFELPGGNLDRKVEVIGLDANGIQRPLGVASVTPISSQDIAVLHITGRGLPEAAIADGPPDDLASVVAILWDPGSSQPRPVTGDLVPTDRGLYGDRLTIQIAVLPGHSGSGLFGADHKLLGIITNQIDGARALAVPAYAFAQFLSPRPQIGRSEKEVPTSSPKGVAERERITGPARQTPADPTTVTAQGKLKISLRNVRSRDRKTISATMLLENVSQERLTVWFYPADPNYLSDEAGNQFPVTTKFFTTDITAGQQFPMSLVYIGIAPAEGKLSLTGMIRTNVSNSGFGFEDLAVQK